MRKSSREAVLDTAVGMLRRREQVSLDSVAAAAGLTKPGLMYHFKTKEALMLAIVDHVVDAEEAELARRMAQVESDCPWPRLVAYVHWMLSGDTDEADLAMLADPRLRDILMARWAERFTPWVAVPEHVDAATRARLDGARYMAEGAWFADLSGVMAPDAARRTALVALADELLARDDADEPVREGSVP